MWLNFLLAARFVTLPALYIPNATSSLSKSDVNFSYGTSLGLKQGAYILFVGRLVPEKCPKLLIEAFQTLNPSGWKLVLVGGSSDTNMFCSKLVEMAASNTDVVFTGELEGAHLAEILRGAGLFVLPSEVEGLPIAMLEAMLEGIPVLASNIPVHQQLIDGERGMLFQAGDVDSCVRGLDWAIHHPQELATMVKHARKYVLANHNWDQITTKTLEVYAALPTSQNALGEMSKSSNQYPNFAGSINYSKVKPLSSYLLEADLLTQQQVDTILAEQEVNEMLFREILLQRGWIKEKTIDYLMQKIIIPEREVERERENVF